ncbi:MAG: CPBP family intramembrane metalloprotease [Chloroflexota bacterium]|nr:CPBP family intramembrane metalloprotease [Chloroflexota bacterium]
MITFSPGGSPTPFWKRFAPLFGVGLLGIAASVPLISRVVTSAVERTPAAPPIPLPALVAVSVAQTAALMAGAVAAGTAAAPGLGLRSHLAERKPLIRALRPELPLALGLGAASGIALIAADRAFQPWTGTALLAVSQDQLAPATTIWGVLARLLYGGITEELLLRWGLMSALAWLMWRVLQRGRNQPRPAIVWTANITSAGLFGVGHIPAAAAFLTLSAPLVVQIVLVNSLAGIVFGWLF